MEKLKAFLNSLKETITSFWAHLNEKTGLLDKAHELTRTEGYKAFYTVSLIAFVAFAFQASVIAVLNMVSLICLVAIISNVMDFTAEESASASKVGTCLWAALAIYTLAVANPILGLVALALVTTELLAAASPLSNGRAPLFSFSVKMRGVEE